MIFALIVIVALLLIATKVLQRLPFVKKAVGSGRDWIKILEVVDQCLGIIFPALISVFLYLHLDKDVIYIEAAEAISGIVLSAAIAVLNIIFSITGGKHAVSN